MPRPLKRRRYPAPKPITVRQQDSETAEVVRADDFVAYQHRRSLRPVFETPDPSPVGAPFDNILDLQRLFALETGDVVRPTSPRAAGLWWFVVEVNGPERTVLARTRILGVQREEEFRFEEIGPGAPGGIDDRLEADAYRRRLGLPAPRRSVAPGTVAWLISVGRGLNMAVPSLPARYHELLDLPRERCHGYSNGCECGDCDERRWNRYSERAT